MLYIEKKEERGQPGTAMALFSNIFSCFSESSGTSKYICNGDVCVLRDQKAARSMKLKSNPKQRIRTQFSRNKSLGQASGADELRLESLVINLFAVIGFLQEKF
ncbi:unnamed protein product [Ilex paraguariensis]|uniref:Uncharacterized protein n=1 Tax=Ilex paraguariensis TaxID=185542 RepID=A0ABC8TA88_9AQUA